MQKKKPQNGHALAQESGDAAERLTAAARDESNEVEEHQAP